MRPCQCCGCLTVEEKYDICPVCFWEDDDIQARYPDLEGGANRVSLEQARENYARFGACDERFAERVRPPFEEELPEHEQ